MATATQGAWRPLARSTEPSVFRMMFRGPIGVWLIGCAAIPEQHRVRAAATFVGWSERRS